MAATDDRLGLRLGDTTISPAPRSGLGTTPAETLGPDVSPNILLTKQQAQGKLDLTWSDHSPVLKTVLIYDQDAPQPPPGNVNSPFLHYLAVNSGRDIIMPYTPPSPPAGSQPHTYYVELYHQTGPITHRTLSNRIRFKVFEFANDHKLTLVDRLQFQVMSGPDQTDPPPTHPEEGIPFRADTSLTERQQKYCRCVLKVAEKQARGCDPAKRSQGCYNSYAVCGASTHGSVRHCSSEYDFDNFSDRWLLAYARLHSVTVPDPYDRDVLLRTIKDKI